MQNSVVFGILLKLLKGKRIKTNEMAEDFEVSQRTILRYIDVLSSSGVPLLTFSGKNGGVEIDKNFVLNDEFI
ncbi:MAG: HTH domain-containing protein, partial [Clostridiales bacterium]|nr:HTH domain-containing protein [Candidatus Apopatousia equi]